MDVESEQNEHPFCKFRHRRAVKVVVAGGTGFIGTKLVSELELRGDDVVVLSRSASRAGAAEKRVKRVAWTPDRLGDWVSHLEGADAVVNLSGAGVLDKRWSEERFHELRSSRIESTSVLARAIAQMKKKPSVFLSGSAVGYYGMKRESAPVDESAPPGEDRLAQLCVDWERAAGEASAAGVRVVHPRIGIVLSNDGGALKSMVPAFKAWLGGPIGSGKQYFPWIHSRDTVRGLVFAIDSSTLTGPFNLTGPQPTTMNEFANELARTLERPAIVRVPPFALRLVLGEMADVLLTGQRAVPKKLNDAGFAFIFPEVKCALGELFGPPKGCTLTKS